MKSIDSNGKTTVPQESQSPRPQTKLSADMSPALIAQANWTFVEKLLKVKKKKKKKGHLLSTIPFGLFHILINIILRW